MPVSDRFVLSLNPSVGFVEGVELFCFGSDRVGNASFDEIFNDLLNVPWLSSNFFFDIPLGISFFFLEEGL